LTQVNGVAPAFHSRVKRSIAAVRTRTFSKLPRNVGHVLSLGAISSIARRRAGR